MNGNPGGYLHGAAQQPQDRGGAETQGYPTGAGGEFYYNKSLSFWWIIYPFLILLEYIDIEW